MSQIPYDLKLAKPEDLDREILRIGIMAELDAINLYYQMARLTKNKGMKTMLVDIAREEKTHVGEFQTLLLKMDAEQVRELKKGKEEVEEKTGK